MDCLTEDALVEFVEGRIPAEASRQVEAHLEACADCRTLLATTPRGPPRKRDSTGDVQASVDPLLRDVAQAPEHPLREPRAPIGPGARLGPYEIEAGLGEGGMGEVYRAHDPRLGREVAMKVLHHGLEASADLFHRFEQEARAAGALNHPNILAIYDIGTQEGRRYIVSELLEGETLRQRMGDAALPSHKALDFAAQIARGLAAAHEKGIVHRDLKPENLFVTNDGRVKILDFGLAKLTHPERSTDMTAAPPPPHTQTGIVLGTVGYMSPEQVRGDSVDHRSDLFSFGVILYEMISGRRAFQAGSAHETLHAILKEEPPPLAETKLPSGVERIVRHCLEKRREERFQSARDLAFQLEMLLDASGQGAAEAFQATSPPARGGPRSRERLAWILAVLAALAAVFASWVPRHKRHMYPHPVRAFIAAPEKTTFAFMGDFAGPAEVSPDGTRLAFSAMSSEGVRHLWVHPLDALGAKRLAGTEGATFPFWSPDGRSLGFFAEGKLKRVDLSGGPPTTLCDAPNGRGGAWSAHDVILFAPDWRAGLHRVAPNGGASQEVTKVDGARHTTHRWPQFLPDGRHFLFLAAHHQDAKREYTALYVASLHGGEPRLLMRTGAQATYAAGHLLFLQQSTLLAQRFDTGRLELGGAPRRVAESIQYDPFTWRAVFSASGSSVLAYRAGGIRMVSRLVWFDRAGKELGTIGDKGYQFDLRLSPDGKRLALQVGDPGDIWIYDLTRTVRTRFTFDFRKDAFPVWSPDGSHIAFSSSRRSTLLATFVKRTEGGGAQPLLTDASLVQLATDWSPDGRFIAYTRSPALGGEEDIWVLPLFGDRRPFPLMQAPFRESGARFSPGGRWIAYTSNESGRDEIYVASFPGLGGKSRVSPAGGRLAVWRRDGKELFYLAPDRRLMAAPLRGDGQRLEVGAVQPLFATRAVRDCVAYDVSLDGQRFLVNNAEEEESSPLTVVINWMEGVGR